MSGVPRIEIVIDELIVRGLSPAAAQVAAASIQERLAALVAEPGAAISGRDEASRRLPAIEAAVDAPAALGATIAGTVWSAIGGGSR